MPSLSSIRVADFTSNIAGPYCTMLLGDQGAEVLKIEAPDGDAARNWGSWHDDKRSFMFMAVNRNKRSVVLDLKSEEGRELARELMATCHVVAQSFAPGVAERLGIGFEDARAANPEVVYLSISGYGLTGPYRHKAGFDSILQAETGIMEMNGVVGGPTCRIPVSALDYATGSLAYGGVVTQLLGNALGRPSGASHIDMSLFDAAVSILGAAVTEASVTGVGPVRAGGSFAYQCPFGVYQASDGEFFLGVGSVGGWKRFCQVFGLADLAADGRFDTNPGRLRHRLELESAISAAFARLSVAECVRLAEVAAIPASPINRVLDLLESPHAQARESLMYFPTELSGSVAVPGLAWRTHGQDAAVEHRAPEALGQSTEEVLSRLERSHGRAGVG